jgi:hypothetical protein
MASAAKQSHLHRMGRASGVDARPLLIPHPHPLPLGAKHYPYFPPPWWGRMQVGGKAAPVFTPTPTLPHRGGGEGELQSGSQG